jgi:hypothetical protein
MSRVATRTKLGKVHSDPGFAPLAGAGSEWEDRIAAAVRWGKAARLGCGIRRRDP